MGLLRKLFGDDDKGSDRPWEHRPKWLTDGVAVALFGGSETLEVVGESSYKDGLDRVVRALGKPEHQDPRRDGGVRIPSYAVLVAEDNNPYDQNAISVWVSGHKAGYLSKGVAADYRAGLLRLQESERKPIALECVIIGRPGLYGVFLNHDPGDFGISLGRRRSVPPQNAELRTGLSEAISSDKGDDSYDLGWMDSLPRDTAKRIPKLRRLLQDESDPIARHFMFSQLESDLYTCRELWSSALTEYDEVAELHHSELVGGIREALLAKFGLVPLIETYRQAAIRSQKAGDWQGCLEWARRGLAMYGQEAARGEAVEDLEKREKRALEKLGQI